MSILDPNIDVNYGCLISANDIAVYCSLPHDQVYVSSLAVHKQMSLDRISMGQLLEHWLYSRTECPTACEIKAVISEILGIPKYILSVRRIRCIYEEGRKLHVFYEIKLSSNPIHADDLIFIFNKNRYKLESIHFNWTLNAFAPKDNYKF